MTVGPIYVGQNDDVYAQDVAIEVRAHIVASRAKLSTASEEKDKTASSPTLHLKAHHRILLESKPTEKF